jgi:hypothetical protein
LIGVDPRSPCGLKFTSAGQYPNSGEDLQRPEQALGHHRRLIMTRISTFRLVSGTLATSAFAVLLAVLGSMALAAQDKYTVKVPNGLPFAEFRGYEDWQTVTVSQIESSNLLRAILANPVMINAYRAGIPDNGKPFPNGSKIAKLEWTQKKITEAPGP